MNAKRTPNLAPLALGGAALLAGCAATPPQNAFTPPQKGDGGVVIATSSLVSGVTAATTGTGQPDDCGGPGMGVRVQTSTGTGQFLYDKNGEPCEAAHVLFDGGTPLGSRAADPAIQLTVFDSLGPLPRESAQPPSLTPLPRIKVTSQLVPALAAVEPAAGPAAALKAPAVVTHIQPQKPDTLVATLTQWQAADTAAARRDAEANAAAERNLANIAKQTRDSQSDATIAKLMSQLRERERMVEEERRRNEETMARAAQNRATTTAAQQAWQQKEEQLQAELSATQQRLQQFQQLSQQLAADKASKEKAYQSKITSLNADLQAAEQQADASRRDLVLKAAAKIAEAEQLAHAAQIQEQDARLREAARLKAEAETMMDRALAIKTGNNVVVGGVGAPAAAPMALMQTPVVLHASGQTLKDILADVLKQASAQAGDWQADWQLSGKAAKLLREKWSLTAEAPVQQVLKQLAQQVHAADGITLSFTQFNQSRLLVVTDDAATPAE